MAFVTVTQHIGWCEDSNGHDQGRGVVVLGITDDGEQCRMKCQQYKGATGCEFNKGGGCAVHTQVVKSGSGNTDYVCWVFSSIL